MAERIDECAEKLCTALKAVGRLDLWQVRAILAADWDFSNQVLLWLAAGKRIVYDFRDGRRWISLPSEETA